MRPGERAYRRKFWMVAALALCTAGAIYAGEQEFASPRAAMVADLRRPTARQRIRDEQVLKVMGRVPRHRFVPDTYRSRAYTETEIPIGNGEVMAKPYVVALMTQTLGLKRGARVLEVGTGIGYQTAILAELCGRVRSVERHRAQSDAAAVHLYALGYKDVKLRIGEEAKGWPSEGPYDAILVTAPVDRVPNSLLPQLARGGCLVYMLGRGPEQTLNRLRRKGDVLHAEAVIPVRMSSGMGQPRRAR